MEDPRLGYLLTTDMCMSDFEKRQKFIDWVIANNAVISMIGKRGGGKTAFCCWLAERMREHMEVYWMEINYNLPSWIHIVDDWDQVPNGALVIVDEN
jgi:hypothetical protein